MSTQPPSTSASSTAQVCEEPTLYFCLHPDGRSLTAVATERIPDEPKVLRATLERMAALQDEERFKGDKTGSIRSAFKSFLNRINSREPRPSRQHKFAVMTNIDYNAINKILADNPNCYPVISKGSTTACFEKPAEATSSAPTEIYHDDLAQTVPDNERLFMPKDQFTWIGDQGVRAETP
jgi:hypothetical protein